MLGLGGGLRRVRARAGRQLRVRGRDGATPRQGPRGAGAGARRPPAASISTWPHSHSLTSREYLQYLHSRVSTVSRVSRVSRVARLRRCPGGLLRADLADVPLDLVVVRVEAAALGHRPRQRPGPACNRGRWRLLAPHPKHRFLLLLCCLHCLPPTSRRSGPRTCRGLAPSLHCSFPRRGPGTSTTTPLQL